MAFEIDHDWQGNLATPVARIGEKAKTKLLVLLCVIWVTMGIFGHQPWKPYEAGSVSLIKNMLDHQLWLSATAASQVSIENPPLFYWSAALFGQLLSPVLSLHDAARVASAFWMSLTLLVIGMIGREIWGQGLGRQTTFILISSVGLLAVAHALSPALSALTGSAMAIYGLALARRRPFRASALLGCGIGIGFLSTGLITALISIIVAVILPLLFQSWRSKSYAIVLGLALLISLPWLSLWPAALWYEAPEQLMAWWKLQYSFYNTQHINLLRTLSWAAWPALPLAGWGIWHFRNSLLNKPKFQLILIYLIVAFILIGLSNLSEAPALTLLLPLTLLAGGTVETLKRGAAGALNWFGLFAFGLVGILIWIGWIAFATGWPDRLSVRMHFLSGLDLLDFNWISLIAAILATVVWVVTINTKRSNRAAITDWAVGITMVWSLLMTLWLPLIDNAKSYYPVAKALKEHLPKNHGCINSIMGNDQTDLLHYYINLKTEAVSHVQKSTNLSCHLLLIQADKKHEKISLGNEWELIWQGKRPADRNERFRLYQRKP
jgi:4-amino-4-deoxy-L-arabinose transferase-like glycosyltransferase